MNSKAQPSPFPHAKLIPLEVDASLWERFYTVAPLVVIGTMDEDGRFDLAPKHLAMPMSWDPYFGFVCAPTHQTYKNARRHGYFTVTYPQPDKVLLASLAASPRCDDSEKPILRDLPTFPAEKIEGVHLADGHVFLECKCERFVEDLGPNCLIIGSIVAARILPSALRTSEMPDEGLLEKHPLLAFLYPNRFAQIQETLPFPFPKGFKK